MTFQFIVEYFEPASDIPFVFGLDTNDAGCFSELKIKRVRARTGEKAVEKFKKKYPEFQVVNWRK